MFLSESRFEHRIPPQLVGPGMQSWRVVELSLHTTWYIATLRDASEGCLRDLLVGYDADLVRLIESDGSAIEALHRVTPVPATGGWQMDAVVEVRRIQGKDEAGPSSWEFLGKSGIATYWPRSSQQSITRRGELIFASGRN